MKRNLILSPLAHLLKSAIRLTRWHQTMLARCETRLTRLLPNQEQIVVRLPQSQRAQKLRVSGEFGKTLFLDGLLGYETTTTRLWFEFCKQADLVLDIGAHLGVFTLLAADANPASRVFSFEPLPSNFDYLCEHIRASGIAERITPSTLAISDRNGSSDLLLRGTSGSTLATDFWADSASLQRIQIQTITLDHWLAVNRLALTPHSVIKMDVETHEPAILRGASHALSCKPAIFCEVLATFTENELAELLPALQWKYFWIGPDGPVERRRIIGDPAWRYANYLFLSHDSPFLSLVSR